VEPGELDPEAIVTPGIFVKHLVKVEQSASRATPRAEAAA
jgi:acyl CoA:acetate/3-ketoacid CoA transferase alpha subunit